MTYCRAKQGWREAAELGRVSQYGGGGGVTLSTCVCVHGMVWHGVIWHGGGVEMVRHDSGVELGVMMMAWCGMIWHGVAWCGMVSCGSAMAAALCGIGSGNAWSDRWWHGLARCGIAWRGVGDV